MNTAITFHDLVSYSLGVNPNDLPVNIKRNGIYIPKPETVDQMELVDATLFRTEPVDYDDDDISTWEFHAPVASISWQSDASICTSPSQTPAQDVVYRYRAGLKVDLGEPIAKRSSSPETKSDSSGSWFDDSASSSGTSFETSSTISSLSLPLPVQQEVRPLFRESRANALLDIVRPVRCHQWAFLNSFLSVTRRLLSSEKMGSPSATPLFATDLTAVTRFRT